MAQGEDSRSGSTPTAQGDRLVTLDFVRGVAVLGIVLANIVPYGHTYLAAVWPPALAGGANAADRIVWLVQFVLVDGKLRGLFTLLFGASMMLFAQRAGDGAAGAWLQARRLGWLFVFGMAHLLLLWHGDILHGYALAGLFLLTSLHWPPDHKLAFGLALYLFGSAILALQQGAPLMLGAEAQLAETAAESLRVNAAELALYQEGSYFDIVRHVTFERADGILMSSLTYGLIETIPLAIIGMALFELGLFSGAIDRSWLRLWGSAALLGGGAATLGLGLWVHAKGFPIDLTFFVFIGAAPVPRLAMIIGLAFLLAAWAPRAAVTALGQRFAAAGQMAFSNYIGTSLLLVPLFNGWGLGLFGRYDRIELLAFVAAIWALMLLWSRPWLQRFRHGPLEWVWRCLTYSRMVPLRRPVAIEIDSH
ncbi:uncharacterized protein B0I00_1670 [Novosphingobium kunmingense]|uniref:DUF418 domain-containing protein n=1 Tax=Novosphingobium kunmingense TaxID=1211806 RepID=A0A2N0HKF5_9SPHN|nr:DUF418 domain-containing protein [Novosphingobium kunmingense]PKB19436.1 uncharacterized protein B0I00_1670 [Novosphingobium kunmingense]